ncbi:hypothetical protein [Nocardia thraciensis]
MDSGEQSTDRPTAVCMVRGDVSGLKAPEHAVLAQRHAVQLGYIWLYTVRPPADYPDPIGYGLGMAAGLNADALVVYDLATVDNDPSRTCETFTLETVSPPNTWMATLPSIANSDHTHPDQPLTAAEAHRILQQHIGCRAVACPRKQSAYSHLVRIGKIVPPVDTVRERAAARGLDTPPSIPEQSEPSGPDLQTLLNLLDGLASNATDSHLFAARLSPGSEG